LRNRTFVFKDRSEAGERLSKFLLEYRNQKPVVLAIPNGGVPVGIAVSQRLGAPFDLIVSRKMPLPHTREAGFGAITWDDIVVYNEELIAAIPLNQHQIEQGLSVARKELHDRTSLFRGDRPWPKVKNRFVILVDDGLASGFTMIAAATFARRHRAAKIVTAVPTSPVHSIARVASCVDELVCLNIREGLSFAVADAYVEWHDLSEVEVNSYLQKVPKWIG
jgi:predicted phosphoribosyltransferase